MIGRRMLAMGGLTILATPARATPREVELEVAKIVGDATPRPGLVTLDLAQMVENGNAVTMAISARPPPGRTVRSLHVFAEGNPNPEVIHAEFGPAAFEPRLATRIRLATSQTVVALAVLDDGSCWSDSVSVIVTLAACLE